jgi:hypothetical protein
MKIKLTLMMLHFACITGYAQPKSSSISVLFGNAPWDFKIGWYEIDIESFDNHDVEMLSYSTGLKYRRILYDNVSFSFRMSYLAIHLKEYNIGNHTLSSAQSKQTKFQVAPGISFSLKSKNLSFLGGFEFPLYFHGDVKTEFTHTVGTTPTPTHNQTYSIIPAGFSAGIAPLMGFVYELSKRFLVEAEFSVLFLYGSTGGKTKTYSPQHPGHESTTQDKLKGFFFEPRTAIGLGYRF